MLSRTMTTICVAALLSASATIVAAQPAPQSATSLRAGLAGKWQGKLGYRDYQTNKLSELPVSTTITAVPDRLTQVRTSEFDEGPRSKSVWITTTSIDDANRVTSATFRVGRPAELQTETMAVVQYTGPTKWKIVYSHTGADDDKPADIRVTETRNGADLLSIKEVRPAGSQAAWTFRNQTRLTRIAD